MRNIEALIRDAQNGTLEKAILNKNILYVFEILLFDYAIDRYDIDEICSEWGYIILKGEVIEGKGKYSEEYEIIIVFSRDECVGVTCTSL